MTKYIVERRFRSRWSVIGSFNTEEEAREFFLNTLVQHLDWPTRRLTVHEEHDGTSVSPALKSLKDL